MSDPRSTDDLLREARAAGVTMIIVDRHRISAWHAGHKHTFQSFNSDPVAGLQDVLLKALDPTFDKDILI